MSRRYNRRQAAEALGFHNVEAFDQARSRGEVLPPDSVFNKSPYWTQETIDEILAARVKGIHAAWGYRSDSEGDGNA